MDYPECEHGLHMHDRCADCERDAYLEGLKTAIVILSETFGLDEGAATLAVTAVLKMEVPDIVTALAQIEV